MALTRITPVSLSRTRFSANPPDREDPAERLRQLLVVYNQAVRDDQYDAIIRHAQAVNTLLTAHGGDPDLQCRMLTGIGVAKANTSDFAGAEQALEQAAHMASQLPMPTQAYRLGLCYLNQGSCFAQQNQPKRAEPKFLAIVTLVEQLNPPIQPDMQAILSCARDGLETLYREQGQGGKQKLVQLTRRFSKLKLQKGLFPSDGTS